MDKSSLKVRVDRYLVAYNAFNVEGMLALLSRDVRFENYSGGRLTVETSGIDAFRRLAEESRALFSEREQRVTVWEFADNSVLVTISFRGKLAADVPGGPSAGAVLELQGESEFSFARGKIVKIVDRS